MAPSFVPIGQLTKTRLVRAINDSWYGAQSIDAATLRVYESYSHGAGVARDLIHIKNPNPALVKRGI
jgi:hypothetical protein